MNPYAAPVLLLVASNVFMTLAWYGHLRFPSSALWVVVLVSWGIALIVFAVFSVVYLKEAFTLNHAVGFGFIAAGAFFVFRGPF